MHAFDIIFYVITAIFIILGLKRGLIDEITRLSAIVAGFVCALLLYRQIVPWFDTLHLLPQVSTACAFIALFVAAFFLVLIIGIFIKKTVRLTMLGWVDRLCGGCLGLVKAFFIGWVIVIALSSIPFINCSDCFSGSKVFTLLHAISPSLQATVTQRGKQVIQEINDRNILLKAAHHAPAAEDSAQPLSKNTHKRYVHHL